MVLMNLSAGQEERCRHREYTGRRGAVEGEMNCESGIAIHTLPCVE